MNEILSNLQLQDIILLSSHFDIANHPPQGEPSITVTVESTETTYEAVDNGLLGTTKMSVIADLVGDGEASPAPNMSMRIGVAVVYLAAGGNDESSADTEAASEIRSHSLTDGYAFARDHAMQLASISPMRRLILPSVDLKSLM